MINKKNLIRVTYHDIKIIFNNKYKNIYFNITFILFIVLNIKIIKTNTSFWIILRKLSKTISIFLIIIKNNFLKSFYYY